MKSDARQVAREQDSTPWLRFSTANSADRTRADETEAVGDADAVKSTAMGMKKSPAASPNADAPRPLGKKAIPMKI